MAPSFSALISLGWSLALAHGLAVPAQTLAGVNASGGNPYLVRLRREVFPVRRKGKVVSFKASYSGVIHVGSPIAQEFRVVFDTGSGHVILPSVECRTGTCLKHRRFDIQRSESAVGVNLDGSVVPADAGKLCDQVTIGFGTGKVTGEFVRDVVCLGPAPGGEEERLDPSLRGKGPCVGAQVVMAIDMSRRPFELFQFDGILGLGLGSLALSANFSFFGLLAGSGQIDHAHFGVFLADTDAGEESEIAIGGHNPARLTEPLAWVPMVNPEFGYWQVEILALHIGGQKLDICSERPCSGILDTGTSHLGIPTAYTEEVNQLLSLEAGQVTDCREAEAPIVRIELREFNLTLYPENYMRKLPLAEDVKVESSVGVTPTSYQDKENSSAVLAQAGLAATSSQDGNATEIKHYCTPKLLPVNLSAKLGGDVFILGEPVLHRYYTVYDWGGLRAGFGLAAHQGQASIMDDASRTSLRTRAREQHTQDEVVLLQVLVTVKSRKV